MIRQEIKNLIEEAVKNLYKIEAEVEIKRPENEVFGDYSANVAMLIKKNPQEIANALSEKLKTKSEKLFEKIEVKNGFINFFIAKEYLRRQIGEILKQGDKFGNLKIGKNQKINVEFISANPTGPLTLGNGRGGFCGDVLANVLEKSGYKVNREYYLNDRGEQIVKLGHSVLGDSEAVYSGEYIETTRKKLGSAFAKASADKIGEAAAKIILKEMIWPAIKKMGIAFDVWFSEKSLYENKEVDKILKWLKNKKLAYQKDGALWFKSTQFGDDKDRVLIKENSEHTYFLSDIAYLKNKFKRGFKKLIFFWGADHYGYIGRLKAAVETLGFKREQVDIIIMQLVRLFEAGKEVRMSKRSGIYVTIDELIDEVGLDIARYFFLTRSYDTQFNFDLDLAKEQSEKNPVYYIQYAYARIHSILVKSNIKSPRTIAFGELRGRQNSKLRFKSQNLSLLNHQSELSLIKQLIRFPEIIEDIAKDYQAQKLPQYALDLATSFHQFYKNCKVITEDKNLTQVRLTLISAAKIVLKNTLDLMGISAPEKM